MEGRARDMMGEQTLVLIKPDGVMRGLVGQILQRFEQAGLKIVGLKILQATRSQLNNHFPQSKEWLEGMGQTTLESYQEYGIDPPEIFGTRDPQEIGARIRTWNYSYLVLGPVVAVVLGGIHAIDVVRKLVGHTLPYRASPGTIRGDFSINAPDLAHVAGSAVKNLVHASANKEEAEREVNCWFLPTEILSWERTDEYLMFLEGENIAPREKEGEEKMNEVAILEEKLEEDSIENPREAAETAFCLAIHFQRAHNLKKALVYQNRCLGILETLSSKALEDVACQNIKLADVLLPDYLYYELAAKRFQEEGIQ